jgi:hypothetical protein
MAEAELDGVGLCPTPYSLGALGVGSVWVCGRSQLKLQAAVAKHCDIPLPVDTESPVSSCPYPVPCVAPCLRGRPRHTFRGC